MQIETGLLLDGDPEKKKGWRHEPGGDDVIQGWPEDRESQ